MRNRIVATGSPRATIASGVSSGPIESSGTARKSSRLVMNRPTPRPVVLTSETDSMTDVITTRSPTTSGRSYVWSQFVATTDVMPSSSSSDIIRSVAESPVDRPSARATSTSRLARSPRMIHAWSIVAGAAIPSSPAARAASTST